jgi:phytoene dehydrogenase-like protein
MKIAVIGGGLGGLACACLLAKQGLSVTLYERAPTLGGRARSQITEGFVLDQGPHAVYLGGPGESVLRSLGVPLEGKIPDASGSLALLDGALHTLPVGMTSMLSTDLLSMGEKLELGWFLFKLDRLDARTLSSSPDGTLATFIETNVRGPRTRRLLEALFRLTTYTNAPHVLDARTAVLRIQQATAHNVLYVHDGWQTIVDALLRTARDSGVAFSLSADVTAPRDADAIVLAMGPRAAHALLPDDRAIAEAASSAIPARASAMQVALRSLPNASNRFALGIDGPYYCAVQSLTARLAPSGSHVVHVAKYGGDGTEEELSGVLDIVQPGWRDALVARRFMPNLVVANAIHRTFTAPSTPNVFVVGDWVAAEGMLLDTVLATARDAALSIARRVSAPKEKLHAA